MSKELYAQGWIPGFPSYDGSSWEGWEVSYFYGIAWSRKISYQN